MTIRRVRKYLSISEHEVARKGRHWAAAKLQEAGVENAIHGSTFVERLFDYSGRDGLIYRYTWEEFERYAYESEMAYDRSYASPV